MPGDAVPCTGVILAGGQALRYDGRPKGLELVHGRRIIDRVADALSAACDSLLLIANDQAAPTWLPAVPCHADVRRDQGSLGGIHAALSHARTAVLVVAWDMPFVPSALLTHLRALGANHDAAVPESTSRRGVEPLCAYYGPACLPMIDARLDAQDRRVVSFFGDVRVARLPLHDVQRYGDPEVMFSNVNSPDELLIAQRHATTPNDRRP